MKNNLAVIKKYSSYVDEKNYGLAVKQTKKRIVTDYLEYLDNLNVKKTTVKHVNSYLYNLSHLKNSSYNAYIKEIKRFYKWLHEQKHYKIDLSPFIVNKKIETLLPKNIPLQEMIKLCTPLASELPLTSKMIRNQAILEFMFSTGVRAQELIEVSIKCLSNDLSECFIASKKKGAPRYVFLNEHAQSSLKQYLLLRDISFNCPLAKTALEQPIFTSTEKDKKAISYYVIQTILSELSSRRICSAITPHMIRHTFATEMLRASGNIRAVQILMGHRSINSTMVYCHLCTEDKLNAINTYHPMSNSDKFDNM